MINRVSNRKRGLKEEDLTRIVQVLLVSRIMYATPYLNLTLANRKNIDTMIRKAYKAALGLPIYRPTDTLLELGIHNTYTELESAHIATQNERLADTETGKAVLTSLKFPIPNSMESTTS